MTRSSGLFKLLCIIVCLLLCFSVIRSVFDVKPLKLEYFLNTIKDLDLSFSLSGTAKSDLVALKDSIYNHLTFIRQFPKYNAGSVDTSSINSILETCWYNIRSFLGYCVSIFDGFASLIGDFFAIILQAAYVGLCFIIDFLKVIFKFFDVFNQLAGGRVV